jgi:hypothetical protein
MTKLTIGINPSKAHHPEIPDLDTAREISHTGRIRKSRTMSQCQTENEPIAFSGYAFALLFDAGHSAKAKMAATIKKPRNGMMANNDTAGLNPARPQIRQSGTMMRTRTTRAPMPST